MRRLIFILVVILCLIGLLSTTNLYEDWLWFKDLGYLQLFWTPLFTKLIVQAINGVFLMIAIFGTMLMLRSSLVTLINDRFQRRIRVIHEHDMAPVAETLDSRLITLALFLISLLVSYVISYVSGAVGWMDYLTFRNATTFSLADPAFGKDLSFYFFRLPFYEILYKSFYIPLLFLSLISAVVYLLTGMFSIKGFSFWRKDTIIIERPARRHLALFGFLLFILTAFNYLLSIYELVYSQHGHVFGAGYTDLHATTPILKILIGVCLLGAVAALVSLILKDTRLLTLPLAGMIVLSVVGYGIWPQAMQSLLVIPNELNYELPYLTQEISMTRYGFGLDKIKEQPYNGTTPIDASTLNKDQATISNIRLNDPRPMSQTYAQVQGMRLYYKFSDIDVERYTLDGQLRQVMLAPRELSSSDIDPKAQTFVNMRFKYTHGFGVAASLANSVSAEGLPNFVIKDIPPVADYPELNITQPRIYFGELTNDWVVTNTTTKEFDYPQGSNNAENSYQGSSGIKLTPFNKFMLSLNHATLRFYLSNEITPNSRILLNRNIMNRVQKLAPFFTYDHDPYMVISGGKLYWIIDAYTTSSYMPYSDPIKETGTNYIRNSVKVVVDAYNGSVNFYLADKTDPVAQTYGKIFPGLLKDLSQMPSDLKAHIRYPEDLFSIQTDELKNFHMLNPTVFYNKEDAWDVASELHTAQSQKMVPYYTVMRLPGETKAEYMLMIPFTPASSETNKRNNMVAWLGARMDGEHYGQLILYEIPKNLEVDGPFQVESRIDQNTDISRQLTLWDQRGSSVIRGNLLTLPINGNFLYVEPIYLQSDQGAIPEMKQVVVVYNDKIVMADTLDAAIQGIFGSNAQTGTQQAPPDTSGAVSPPGTAVNPPSGTDIQSLNDQIDQIKKLLDDMQSQLQALQKNQPKTP